MVDLVEKVKQRARVLHGSVRGGDARAIERVRTSTDLRELAPAEVQAHVRRRHCLATLARELGFEGWPHARAMLSGDRVTDVGTVMHRDRGGAYFNIWSASYEEAQDIRRDHGGYLLGYRRQFLIVEASYIEALDIDPDDPDWDRIARDWVRPADRAAWSRVTDKAIDARLERALLR